MIRAALACMLVLSASCEKRDRMEEWIRDLESEDDGTRGLAATRLGELGPVPFDEIRVGAGPLPLGPREQRAVDALNDALLVDEGSYELSHRSMAMALARLRPAGLQPGLVRCVVAHGPSAGRCMDAIVKIATPDVLAEMLPLLLLDERRRGETSVGEHVKFGLKQTGAAILPAVRAVVEADDSLELSRAVIKDLLWRPMYPLKRMDDASVRAEDALRGADRSDGPVLPGTDEILVIGLRSQYAEVRYWALAALESIGFDNWLTEVSAMLEDPDEDVRTKAKAMLEGRWWGRPSTTK